MLDMAKPKRERTRMIGVRLKPEEYRRLMADADRMYLPLSSYIRHKLFAGETAGVAKRRSSQRSRR